jgi:hypothetical protein
MLPELRTKRFADATAIASAALREGIDTLPVAFLDERAGARDPGPE